MRSQGTRLRHKQSQMPCNLVNFISVNWESEVEWRRQQGDDTRKKERKKGVKSKNPSG